MCVAKSPGVAQRYPKLCRGGIYALGKWQLPKAAWANMAFPDDAPTLSTR